MGGWNMNFKKILMVIFMILGLGLAAGCISDACKIDGAAAG